MSEENELHTLMNEWTFWVIQQTDEKFEIEPIFSFKTIEGFWENYIQFPDVTQMKTGGISLFKAGIRPAWEDPKNHGGFAVRIDREDINYEWENIVLTLIGGQFEAEIPSPKLCGLYMKSPKKGNNMLIELWFENNGSTPKINDKKIIEVLKLGPLAGCAIRPHPH